MERDRKGEKEGEMLRLDGRKTGSKRDRKRSNLSKAVAVPMLVYLYDSSASNCFPGEVSLLCRERWREGEGRR